MAPAREPRRNEPGKLGLAGETSRGAGLPGTSGADRSRGGLLRPPRPACALPADAPRLACGPRRRPRRPRLRALLPGAGPGGRGRDPARGAPGDSRSRVPGGPQRGVVRAVRTSRPVTAETLGRSTGACSSASRNRRASPWRAWQASPLPWAWASPAAPLPGSSPCSPCPRTAAGASATPSLQGSQSGHRGPALRAFTSRSKKPTAARDPSMPPQDLRRHIATTTGARYWLASRSRARSHHGDAPS